MSSLEDLLLSFNLFCEPDVIRMLIAEICGSLINKNSSSFKLFMTQELLLSREFLHLSVIWPMGFSCVPIILYSYCVLNVDVLISVATVTLPQPKKPWSPWDTSSRPRAPLQGKPMETDSPHLDRLTNPHPLGQRHSPPLLEKPCQRRRKKEVG